MWRADAGRCRYPHAHAELEKKAKRIEKSIEKLVERHRDLIPIAPTDKFLGHAPRESCVGFPDQTMPNRPCFSYRPAGSLRQPPTGRRYAVERDRCRVSRNLGADRPFFGCAPRSLFLSFHETEHEPDSHKRPEPSSQASGERPAGNCGQHIAAGRCGGEKHSKLPRSTAESPEHGSCRCEAKHAQANGRAGAWFQKKGRHRREYGGTAGRLSRHVVAFVGWTRYPIHMKRTNLVLDEQVLDQAKALTGTKTYSEVVNLALSELVRRRTFAQIDDYASSDVWEGDLSEMRDDDTLSR